MWNEKKPETKSTDAPRPMEMPVERATGWLGASLRVKGEISGTEDLLIDGPVEGSIHLNDRKLTVGKTAKITADIDARDVVIGEGGSLFYRRSVHCAGYRGWLNIRWLAFVLCSAYARHT